MAIDWNALENQLFGLASDDIGRLAAAHRGETFYGFAFDCNSEYGNVLLCLNTPEYLRQQAVQYAADPPGQAVYDEMRRSVEEAIGRKVFSERKPTTPEQQEQELRWRLGDWKYQGCNSRRFDAGWKSYEQAVLEACMDEEEDEDTFLTPTQDRFMRAVCHVLIRLESTDRFDAINRTTDFKCYVADHDESDDDSWGRLETIRNETTGA